MVNYWPQKFLGLLATRKSHQNLSHFLCEGWLQKTNHSLSSTLFIIFFVRHAFRESRMHVFSFYNLIGGALAEPPEVKGLNPPMLPGSFLPHAESHYIQLNMTAFAISLPWLDLKQLAKLAHEPSLWSPVLDRLHTYSKWSKTGHWEGMGTRLVNSWFCMCTNIACSNPYHHPLWSRFPDFLSSWELTSTENCTHNWLS